MRFVPWQTAGRVADDVQVVLAVDLGRTGCRAVLWNDADSRVLAQAHGEGCVGLTAAQGADHAEQAILAVVRPLLAKAGATTADAICIGAAGALTDPDAARQLACQLRDRLPCRTMAVTSDAITSHAGALAGSPGVVLAAGTGAVALAIGADGAYRRVDGWGPWIGDEGSGAWIGREGLRAVARASDGRGPPTRLQAAARARFGTVQALAARLSAASNPARTAAAFAPDVAQAARDGDALALGLIHQAALALAESIVASAAVLPGSAPVPVAVIGGLAKMGAVLLDPLRNALARGDSRLNLCAAQGSACDGARWLATHEDGIHAAWVARIGTMSSTPTMTPAAGVRRSRMRSEVPAALSRDDTVALDVLATEAARPGLDDLDARSTSEIVRLLVEGQARAQEAAQAAVPHIAAAADAVAARLARGGRLFYVGAGTSGRLAILDAAECPPTFSTPPEMVVALMAGGASANTRAMEGAEDDADAGAEALRAQGLGADDAVIGIAASGRTAFVVGALRFARELGAYTAAIVNNADSLVARTAEQAIELLTGAEVIAGSTRLGAGTAQKIALNTLSTAVMVRLGKTYGPYMIDMRASNIKLRRRALRMTQRITGADESTAARVLGEAGGHLKTAVVALLADCDVAQARHRLERAGGRVREALAEG